MEKAIEQNKNKYWCFNCDKEVKVIPNENKEEGDFKCKNCNSTFIELIEKDGNPSEYKISNKSNNPTTNAQERSLLFLPSTVNCIVFDESRPFSSVLNNVDGLINQFINSNFFMNRHLSRMNTPLLGFLRNHNNDRPFENLLNFIMTFEHNFTGHPPASENAINKLNRFTINENNASTYDKIQCNICLSEFQIGEHLIKLDCSHIFHENCVIRWLKMHNTCPVCREELESNDPNYERRKNSHRETLRNFHESNNNNRREGGGGEGTTA